MASEFKTTQEKCYDPADGTLQFVDKEDELDFFYEGFTSRRALMPCGHAVTPTSLTKWCLKQLDEGKSTFVCGQTGCNVEWSYVDVRKMALLTPEEMEYFEETMASNAAKAYFDTKLCPKCKSSVVRKNDSILNVSCMVCTAKHGEKYEFCWQCLGEWKGSRSQSDRCENEGCCNEVLKALKTCPDISFKSVKGVTGCPSLRVCPTCGALVEHNTTNCKNIVCPRCKLSFCFVCLKLTAECSGKDKRYLEACEGGVAPKQTSIPVWKKN